MDVWMCECADVRIGLRDGRFFRNGLVNLLACAGLPPCIRRGLWLRGMHRGAGGNVQSVKPDAWFKISMRSMP